MPSTRPTLLHFYAKNPHTDGGNLCVRNSLRFAMHTMFASVEWNRKYKSTWNDVKINSKCIHQQSERGFECIFNANLVLTYFYYAEMVFGAGQVNKWVHIWLISHIFPFDICQLVAWTVCLEGYQTNTHAANFFFLHVCDSWCFCFVAFALWKSIGLECVCRGQKMRVQRN